MEIFINIFIFIFGTIIGSFLNVVILRYNTGRTVQGRSACFSCGKKLSWYELIPVLSYIFQGGKCRGCKSGISIQYPLVELATGVVFLASFLKIGIDHTFSLAYIFILCALLVVIAAYDFRHKIIPNVFVYTFSLLAFLNMVHLVYKGEASGIDLLAGPILFLPFFALWWISKGKWIGLGDGKLALGMGWFLGLTLGSSAIIFAFWIGAIFSICLLGVYKIKGNNSLSMKAEIPFAPFLILATFLTYFFQVTATDIIWMIAGKGM